MQRRNREERNATVHVPYAQGERDVGMYVNVLRFDSADKELRSGDKAGECTKICTALKKRVVHELTIDKAEQSLARLQPLLGWLRGWKVLNGADAVNGAAWTDPGGKMRRKEAGYVEVSRQDRPRDEDEFRGSCYFTTPRVLTSCKILSRDTMAAGIVADVDAAVSARFESGKDEEEIRNQEDLRLRQCQPAVAATDRPQHCQAA
ncbi:hypothetical protein WN55_10377 [Dufourea novaeangliae]|uniref:Uncharacterized protein n=1 Tax=Dufourea novaeangliae TaxID=178035 RepID=A0A154P3H4_DUFNO|nr:hypothetical protein WN55_10377 [Dufourea novaeangliae]